MKQKVENKYNKSRVKAQKATNQLALEKKKQINEEHSRDKQRSKYRSQNRFIDKMLEVPQTMPDKFMREIDKKFHFKMHDICSIDSE